MNIKIKKSLYQESSEFKEYKERQLPIKKDIIRNTFFWLFFTVNTVFLLSIVLESKDAIVVVLRSALVFTSWGLFFYQFFLIEDLIGVFRKNKKDFERKMREQFLR